MLPWRFIPWLAVAAQRALADVKFTVPAPGVSIPGGTAFSVAWVDPGDAPSISDLTSYQLFLYSGSNAAPQQLHSITTASFSAGNTFSVTVPVSIGGESTNGYFLGIISTATEGRTVTNFSPRFTLTGMTGVFSDAVTTGLTEVSGTTGPDSINEVAMSAPTEDIDDGPWRIPYNLQDGLTRYAPMQPVLGTAITATNTAPLWPASSVSLASTFLPNPSVVTTLTQAPTFSVSSHANMAFPASQPVDDMEKFLNRWKD